MNYFLSAAVRNLPRAVKMLSPQVKSPLNAPAFTLILIYIYVKTEKSKYPSSYPQTFSVSIPSLYIPYSFFDTKYVKQLHVERVEHFFK